MIRPSGHVRTHPDMTSPEAGNNGVCGMILEINGLGAGMSRRSGASTAYPDTIRTFQAPRRRKAWLGGTAAATGRWQ